MALRTHAAILFVVLGALVWGTESRSVAPNLIVDQDSALSSRELYGSHRVQQSKMAYVTLLYGDEFLLGVRVLGKSLQNTGTKKDMVALVSKGVTEDAMELLEADGWIITYIDLLANPNSKRPARFWGVYTKLKIFNMTNYEKVVFLDADTIVTQNIEDLFECQKFCANLKHSERLNSGVMVVEPSKALFEDMLSKVEYLPSYTGGDQGFLNSYYEDFANARLFVPTMTPEERKAYTPPMERLSTLYNADVGLYVLANKWMVDNTSELRVVHYTLGPLKPWDWWTHWLLKPVDYWQDIRVSLPASLPGTKGGQTPHNRLVVRVMLLVPFVSLAFYNRRLLFQLFYKHAPISAVYTAMINWSPSSPPVPQYSMGAGGAFNSINLPAYLGCISVLAAFSSLLLSLGAAVLLIPSQVMPWTGMILACEWTFFGFFVLFGKYLDLVQNHARKLPVASSLSATEDDYSDYNSRKGHGRPSAFWDTETVFYFGGILVLAIMVPSISFVLGVTALFGRLGLTVTAGIIFAAFLTFSAEHLGIRRYLRGKEEGYQLRSASIAETF